MNQLRSSPIRVSALGDLLQVAVLEELIGPISRLSVEPLRSPGFSGAVLQRVELQLSNGACERLILKRARLDDDWAAYRTEDAVGREAALLAEPRLQAVWDVFACPYRAYASTGGQVGLLMSDLSSWLLPDVDEPLSLADEDRLLAAIAGLHARFWQADVLDLDWLARPDQVLLALDPEAPAHEPGRLVEPFLEYIHSGWRAALDALPPRTAACLLHKPRELVERLGGALPRTLLHGDAKVANFAMLPTGVAAFDWSLVAAGPCTFDLGWYLAVNSGRLARPKEAVLSRYRELLEHHLRKSLPDALWDRMVAFGVLIGARMLLWEKVRGLQSGSATGAAEWDWWVRALEETVLPRM